MNRDYYFNRWPLGTELYDCLKKRVEVVATHLEGTWAGSARPWYGIATVPKIPDLEWWLQRRETASHLHTIREHEEALRPREVLSGTLPDQYFIHCLNGGGPLSICVVDSVKVSNLTEELFIIKTPVRLGQLLYTYISGTYSHDEPPEEDWEAAANLDLSSIYFDFDDRPDVDVDARYVLQVARYLYSRNYQPEAEE